MKTEKSITEFTESQSKKVIEDFDQFRINKKASIPVVTVCMQPGSGGHLIAEGIAKRLDVPLYDQSILVPMANTADMESRMLSSIEKERPTKIQDFISAIINKNYVYTGDYLEYLKEMITIIGELGKGVIVGRGANFVLPSKGRFSIRVVAPQDIRVKNVAFRYGVSLAEARKRIRRREQKRRAFIRESFHKDIENVMYYDLIINTARMSYDAAVGAAIGTIIGAQAEGNFDKENSYILRNRR